MTLNHQFGRTAGMLLDLVLPVLPGCREIQIAANGYLGQGTPLGKNQNFDFGDLICFEASNSTGSEPLIKMYFFFLFFSFLFFSFLFFSFLFFSFLFFPFSFLFPFFET